MERLSARDLATAVWAFGTLQYVPDIALQQDLATASRSRFTDFEPQVMPQAASFRKKCMVLQILHIPDCS